MDRWSLADVLLGLATIAVMAIIAGGQLYPWIAKAMAAVPAAAQSNRTSVHHAHSGGGLPAWMYTGPIGRLYPLRGPYG